MQNESTINEPLDLVRLALDERVFVKLKGERELRGKLHAYDSHCNLVLSDTDETIYRADNAEEGGGIKLEQKRSEMLFVRGDSVVLLSPEK